MKDRLYFYDDDFERNLRTGFVVARDGIFLITDSQAFYAAVPVDPNELRLRTVDKVLKLKDHIRIPYIEMGKAIQFLREVTKQKKTEGFLEIIYDSTANRVYFACPRQRCTAISVDVLEPTQLPLGHYKVGTCHSHPKGYRNHSAGDCQDEEYFDGVHCIVTDLDDSTPTIIATLVVHGNRRRLDPTELIEAEPSFDRTWLERIAK
jgi:hypothetical protein